MKRKFNSIVYKKFPYCLKRIINKYEKLYYKEIELNIELMKSNPNSNNEEYVKVADELRIIIKIIQYTFMIADSESKGFLKYFAKNIIEENAENYYKNIVLKNKFLNKGKFKLYTYEKQVL